jgi:hypothetical protein
MANTQTVKVVGSSGQISLGKKYAGKTVLMEHVEEGVWLVKVARVIPESESWMHEEPAKSRIDQAIAWAKKNDPAETDLEELSGRIDEGAA